jgi:hypothetical protein
MLGLSGRLYDIYYSYDLAIARLAKRQPNIF